MIMVREDRSTRRNPCPSVTLSTTNPTCTDLGSILSHTTIHLCNIGCPTTYQTRHFFNNSKTNEDIATKQTHTTDTFFFISHTTNVLLFKSRCNIFIGFRIIKEMPGLVGSGTPCISRNAFPAVLHTPSAFVFAYSSDVRVDLLAIVSKY